MSEVNLPPLWPFLHGMREPYGWAGIPPATVPCEHRVRHYDHSFTDSEYAYFESCEKCRAIFEYQRGSLADWCKGPVMWATSTT